MHPKAHPTMEPNPQQNLTVGQAHGGFWKNLIERHNLVACQVLTQDEVSRLLNHSLNQPFPSELDEIMDRVQQATRSAPAPARPATATEALATETVTDLSLLSLEELRWINADYLPENRSKLESVILNPDYMPPPPSC
jgi:hypothetical protein